MPWPLYVSPDLGTGSGTNEGLADEYTARRDAGWGSGLFAYWPGSPTWTAQWSTLAVRYPQGFPLLLSPKSTVGVAGFITLMPPAWHSQVLVCYWQEPEDNHTTDSQRAAYRSAVAVMGSIVRPLGVRNGVHLQEWMLDPANTQPWGGEANLAKFVADPASFDVVSWSLYTGFNGSGWLECTTRVRDFMTKHLPSKPWIVGAAGLPVHTGEPIGSANRTVRAGRVRQLGDWLAANGCQGFGWFDVDNYAGNGQDNYAAADPELTAALIYVSQLGPSMADLYPDAQWRPLGPQTEPVLANHDIICLHTMVGSLLSTDNYFHQDGYGGVESHFGVGYDGTVYQWQDLARQADANLDGNDRVVSIETADSGTGFPTWTGSDVPAWTEAQLQAISELVAWLCKRYDIACDLIPDTKQGRRGIGYHRQGIDPWRCSTCERWSVSTGKVCPGDRRVKQISTEIIPRAQAILRGEDMPTADEIAKAVWGYNIPDQLRDDIPDVPNGQPRDAQALIQKLRTEVAALTQAVADLQTAPGGLTADEIAASLEIVAKPPA